MGNTKRGFTLIELLVVVAVMSLLFATMAYVHLGNPVKARRASAELLQVNLANARTLALTKRRTTALVLDGYGNTDDDFKRRRFAVIAVEKSEQGTWSAVNQTQPWQTLAGGVVFNNVTGQQGRAVTLANLSVSYEKKSTLMQAIVFDARGRVISPVVEGDLRLELVSGVVDPQGSLILTDKENGKAQVASVGLTRITGLSYVER